jgi:hypothetical protein
MVSGTDRRAGRWKGNKNDIGCRASSDHGTNHAWTLGSCRLQSALNQVAFRHSFPQDKVQDDGDELAGDDARASARAQREQTGKTKRSGKGSKCGYLDGQLTRCRRWAMTDLPAA